MTVTSINDGLKLIVFDSGLVVEVKDDGSIGFGDVVVSNDEFREIAAIRHVMKN